MIAVAALSARLLVHSARQDGERCIALDLFGDLDTRLEAAHWQPIGDPAGGGIDGERLLEALSALARGGRARAWIAGSGFEGQPELLALGVRILPLLGTAGADVRRLRDPRAFFGALDEAGIAHPPVRHDAPPPHETGWLRKDAGGSGGWHVLRPGDAGAPPPGPQTYWQRERPAARPMSATFVADGLGAVVLGFNLQRAAPVGGRPHVFHGVVGPVPVDDAVAASITAAVEHIAVRHCLRGLCSLDFLLHEGQAEVIEVNPRPPASLALYPRIGDGGPWRAHLQACRAPGMLPPPRRQDRVRGTDVVYAAAPLRWGDAAACLAAAVAHVHDVPPAGNCFAPGQPVCSLSAEGADATAVQALLDRRRVELIHLLEPLS